METIIIDIKDLYTQLKQKSIEKHDVYSKIDFVIRIREGIKAPHAEIILNLFWYHLFLENKELYDKIGEVETEAELRVLFKGKIQSACVLGERLVNVCSDLF